MDVDNIAAAERQGLTERLLPDEQVHEAFRSQTTVVLFTDRRILTIQRHTLLTERIETSSYSYRAVQHFAVLESGVSEAEGEGRSEIRIWLGADPHPLHLRANSGADLAPLQLLLASRLT